MKKDNILLQTTGITKIYETNGHMVTAISDLSLKVNFGEFVIIFGSSASGKSTLFTALYGLEKPDIGEVIIKGESLYDFSETERKFLTLKKFGLMPESKMWLKRMTLLENVALPLILDEVKSKEAFEIAKERLEHFGLQGNLSKLPEQYSNYEQRVASLARATINKPWVVFVDEPYKGLTQEESFNIIGKIKDFNKESGTAIIMTSTDPEYLSYATRWYFLNNGRLEDIESEKNSLKRLKESIELVEKNELINKKQNETYDFI